MINRLTKALLSLSLSLFSSCHLFFEAKQFISFCLFSSLDPTGNNHDATELQEVVPADPKEEEIEGGGGGEDEASGFKVKERSILQAKLTKLAIQIGYAGNIHRGIFRQDIVYFDVISGEL